MNRRSFLNLLGMTGVSAALPTVAGVFDPVIQKVSDTVIAPPYNDEIASGWQRFPGGILIQWGTAVGGRAVFPMAFEQCFSVQAITEDELPVLSHHSLTDAKLSNDGRVCWLAIGFHHEPHLKTFGV